MSRLDWGRWSARDQRYIGVGDIIASYSGDRIALGKPIRKPFEWQGAQWLTVALDQSGASAYRLIPAGTVLDDGPRPLPRTKVSHDGREWLLRRPPARFTAKDEQLRLFNDG